MINLKVVHGGLFTTIQDYGRIGVSKFGIPKSGVMDVKAYELANWLVGNPTEYPALELTLQGGTYHFESDTIIAITGALMNPKLNGVEIQTNKSYRLKSGDMLHLGFAKRGCRTYLAIRGKLNIEKVMNSYSTYITGNFGGLEGRTLQKGDELSWTELPQIFKSNKISPEQIPYYSSKVTVRITKSLEWDLLDEEVKNNFLTSRFEISSQTNRMGIRLIGNPISTSKTQMISSAVIPGIIQLPPNGDPIILMVDGQTVGGYPRIAKVLDEDLWRLGQVKPGDKVGFELVD